ncbi:MAG: lytic murein transglycosylase, partial [Sphingobacteriia bacterium]|nr:lytic murein transglycosylase [Sphingobacteriia bacterium]
MMTPFQCVPQGVAWCILLLALPVLAETRVDQDALFLAAERALSGGDLETHRRLSSELAQHPLAPYLEYAALTRDLAATSDAAIESFLARFPRTPLATRLRPVYLARLADSGRWLDYARVDRPDESTARQCLYLRALIETDRAAEAFAQVPPLWLSAQSQPEACNPVFNAWQTAGGLTHEQIRARFRLAMEAGETALARELTRLMPAAERGMLEAWLRIDADPARIPELDLSVPDPLVAPIIAHGLVAEAGRAPLLAADRLVAMRARLATDPAAADRAHAAVGQALTRMGDPRGLEIWDALRATPDNLAAQETRLRAAVARASWDWVVAWVERMPNGAVKSDRWLYWQGRAEQALGRPAAAAASLGQAAAGRSLWAFLAADRLGRPYRLVDERTPADPALIRAVVQTPAFERMRVLARLGREIDLRREWRDLTLALDAPELLAAAFVADVMGWYDQAIQALARADHWDDLALRFPLAYHEQVADQAAWQGLDPAWILAVIRQESLFARTLASPAGAMGLMQLMPATARETALR